MINPAGLIDQAIRYQRDAQRAAEEAMDLRIALGCLGKDPVDQHTIKPTEEQVLMSRRYDETAKAMADRAHNALQFLLMPHTAFERAA